MSVRHRVVDTYEAYLSRQQAELGEDFSADDYERVEVGDFGVWWRGPQLASLTVFTGRYSPKVAANTPAGDQRAFCVELARKAIARLE